jgi:hypothetical protein
MTFRKPSISNKLDPYFHCVFDRQIPDKAFVFEGALRSIPTVFQIWKRSEAERERLKLPASHRDFQFIPTPSGAQFALQRIGPNAGMTHRNFESGRKSDYFVQCNIDPTFVVTMMNCLPLRKLAENTAGPLSLSKGEIVYFYSLLTGRW